MYRHFRGQDRGSVPTSVGSIPVLPCGAVYSRFRSTPKQEADPMKKAFTLAVLLCLHTPAVAAERYAKLGMLAPLMEAIARQESGLNPLAVNIAGKSYYPATRDEAEQLIQGAIAAGLSFDVSKMQINSWWIERLAIDPFSLLDLVQMSVGYMDTGGRNRPSRPELESRGQIPFSRPGTRQKVRVARLLSLSFFQGSTPSIRGFQRVTLPAHTFRTKGAQLAV